MNLRAIPRTAVDGYLTLVRMPLDAAIRRLPGNGNGSASAAGVALDRADATLRTVAGRLLGDSVLLGDAQQRHAAVAQRASAVQLRDEATEHAERADAQLYERQQQAARQRMQADQRASTRRQQATRQAEQAKRRAAETESERLATTRKAAERRERAISEQEPRERLEAVSAKEAALHQKEKEIAARKEAQRLAEATRRVKTQRKAG
jgi:hypothetical protein